MISSYAKVASVVNVAAEAKCPELAGKIYAHVRDREYRARLSLPPAARVVAQKHEIAHPNRERIFSRDTN
jgi:hypothetical protein